MWCSRYRRKCFWNPLCASMEMWKQEERVKVGKPPSPGSCDLRHHRQEVSLLKAPSFQPTCSGLFFFSNGTIFHLWVSQHHPKAMLSHQSVLGSLVLVQPPTSVISPTTLSRQPAGRASADCRALLSPLTPSLLHSDPDFSASSTYLQRRNPRGIA